MRRQPFLETALAYQRHAQMQMVHGPVRGQPQRSPVCRFGLDETALMLVDQTDIVMGDIGSGYRSRQ